jgi:uncharacterized protein (TIGR00106 family)
VFLASRTCFALIPLTRGIAFAIITILEPLKTVDEVWERAVVEIPMQPEQETPMIAEFSINPMDSTHISKDLAFLVEILEESGLSYRIGPMGTCVEGGWERVMGVVRQCHQAMAARHERVVTNILIDDRKDRPHKLADMVKSVEEHLSSLAPTGGNEDQPWTGEL